MKKLLTFLLFFNINLYAEYCFEGEVLIHYDTFNSVTSTLPSSGSQYVTTNCNYVYFWNYVWNAERQRYFYTKETYKATFSCPTGTIYQNGVCVDEPSSCPTGYMFDPYTKTCIFDPALADHDSDGIPNKCDPNYVDYLTSDCDGDGVPNSTDLDIDGDGIPNMNDTNPFVAGANDYDVSCKGVDNSQTNSLPFPFSTYKYHSNLEEYRCSNLLLVSYYDSVVSLSDINAPYCEYSYCYVHEVQNNCSFDSSWYRPGINWDYIPNVSEIQCNLLVDGIKYSTNSFVTPDILKCSDVGFCYVKRIDPEEDSLPTETNSENNDESMGEVDLNSTTSDLAPLLNAQNTTNKHLQDLKDKTDHSNKRLDDLKDLSSKALDVNKDIKSGIDGLKSNSDISLKNQSDGLSKLASINSAIDGASKKIGTMSDTITGNQVIGNGALHSIDGKMSTNNNLLTDIKDSLSGDGSAIDTSANDGFSDLLTGDSDFLDFATTEFSTFKDNINSNFADIDNQYKNAKSLFENPLSSPSFGGSYNSSCFSFNMLGKNVVLDFSFLGAISPVVYFVLTLTFMILNFRFLLNHLLRGDN
ncbi:hypothetical protein FCU45_07930 [Sulfurimonas crateris]|uniref:Uncharacterized protein n=1 Tax=Sulfurimonas crateris TaxID=2574727 RepID=A0A4U2Z4Y3_9BACT|nr:thrombospondin type 3 repeat-containing protein [Sulfurimonas crateris]TKI68884.1 hypothetical protein FCU45_07930 [Sulfurimonas crateris]